MAAPLAELPEIKDWHGFNQLRWIELCADRALAALDYRIETDEFGHIVMSPPPALRPLSSTAIDKAESWRSSPN